MRKSMPVTGALAALAMACGGSEPPPKTPKADIEDEGGQQVAALPQTSAEIGALDEDQVQRTFQETENELMGCRNDGALRLEFLGGSVTFFLKIDSTGRVAHAHLEKSTLGDRETERCMMNVLARQTWPKPVGGDHGIARSSVEFDANDVRPPNAWSSDRVTDTLEAIDEQARECKNGVYGRFTATVYVEQAEEDEEKGVAVAVGVAPPDEEGEAAVDCLVEVLRAAEYPDPGSWPAKVTFTL